ILKPDTAGFVGGSAWLVLILVPSIGLREAAELAVRQRYGYAWRLVRALSLVHPADGLLEQSDLLRALAFAQRGDFASARTLLGSLRNNHTSVGRQAMVQSFRFRNDWNGLLKWLQT